MSKLRIFQLFSYVIGFASIHEVTSGQSSTESEPVMKFFAEALIKEIGNIEEIKRNLEAEQKRNNGLAVELFGVFSNQRAIFKNAMEAKRHEIVRDVVGFSYRSDSTGGPIDECFNVIKNLSKIEDRVLDASTACLMELLEFGFNYYLKATDIVINAGLNDIIQVISHLVQRCDLHAVGLESYMNAEKCRINGLNRALTIELNTTTLVELMSQKFQTWYETVPTGVEMCQSKHRIPYSEDIHQDINKRFESCITAYESSKKNND